MDVHLPPLDAWWRRQDSGDPLYLEAAALLLLIPLLSPQGWDYVFLIATPAIVYLANYLDLLPRSMRTVTIVAVATIAFSLFDLIAHAAKTRDLAAGTMIGTGTISNKDLATGYACLMEARVVEQVEKGAAVTPFLMFGDREDRPAGIFMSFLFIFSATVVATAAAIFSRKVQNTLGRFEGSHG